jgi:prolyl-tRNA synthetase
VFDITYQDVEGKRQHVWQTSWGVSTRLIGALVMTHGDDQGLRLPPQVAPIQAVVVPIWRKDDERGRVLEFVARVREAVGGRVRLHVDDRDQYTPGWKYNEYEMRGVPVRLEVGPKDVANDAVMSVRRDQRLKESIPLASLADRLPVLLADVQASLFRQAREFRDANTVLAADKGEVIAHFGAEKRGLVAVAWDGSAAFEAEVKEKTGATLRCMPFDRSRFGSLERDGHRVALFARAY